MSRVRQRKQHVSVCACRLRAVEYLAAHIDTHSGPPEVGGLGGIGLLLCEPVAGAVCGLRVELEAKPTPSAGKRRGERCAGAAERVKHKPAGRAEAFDVVARLLG